jgi:hypothetical protein
LVKSKSFLKNVILSEAKNPRGLKARLHASHFAGASFNMTSPLRTNKETPPVSRRGPLSNCPNYRVIVMQQAPGQQAPPSQQPASLDEIVVALVSVIIAAIKSKYFIFLSC